jgi:hypothetical protein
MKLRPLLSLLVLVMLQGVITGCGIELSESAVDADEYLGSRSTPVITNKKAHRLENPNDNRNRLEKRDKGLHHYDVTP